LGLVDLESINSSNSQKAFWDISDGKRHNVGFARKSKPYL